ncbi:MAG: pyrroline-5-carboxylate reductase [Oscillospiraceae bacterium]|nr:pyrroline-5-carboxylate reductase [Oscillospiraceae bacterium]
MKLGFIGAGNMAGAVIRGILKSGLLRECDIAVTDIDPQKRGLYRAAGHPVYDDGAALTVSCTAVVLAVKPQQMRDVLALIAPAMTPDKLLISIAAGVSAQTIKSAIGFDCKVVLAMPNMPLTLGFGATALSRAEPATPEDFRFACSLFGAAGVTQEIPPDKMNEIIPINGSGPAFLYKFAELIIAEAAALGICPDAAMRLFCQTMIGSAKMLLESGKPASKLIEEVCSPGGTTLAGLDAFEEHGFGNAVRAGFRACANRAAELSEINK